jgi:hypothetical protein
MLAWLFLAACSGKDSTDDSGPHTDDSAVDDSGGEEITYPEGDRILMYYGHGGFQSDIAGNGSFEAIGEIWKDTYGWNSDHYNYWPEDMAAYRMIGLVAPGWLVDKTFSGDDIAVLQAALDRGARIAVFGETDQSKAGTCAGADIVNPLLAALGVTWTMIGKGGDTFSVVETNNIATGHQMTEGVSELRMIDPCWVDAGEGKVLVADSNNNFLSVAERPGTAGEVVFVGDITMLDDAKHGSDVHGFEELDNESFAKNLVRITPK